MADCSESAIKGSSMLSGCVAVYAAVWSQSTAAADESCLLR